MLVYFSYRLYLIGVFLGLLLFMSCNKEVDIKLGSDLPSRTILYYLAADNSLYAEADEKISALRSGFPGGGNNLVIYRDSHNASPELLSVYVDATGQNQIRTVKTYSEQNGASGTTFQSVVDDVERLFPAASYGLILFSHASGWLPKGTLTRPESAVLQMNIASIQTYTVAMDGSDELDLQAFAASIPDHFFDFIGFEACFMAGIEVLYELKDKTDYILSSSAEIVSPGFLPIYPTALPMLYQSQPDLVGFARSYFDFWNAQPGDYRSATISVVKTSGLASLATWIRQHATGWVATDGFADIQHFDRYPNHRLFFDFADYYGRKVGASERAELELLLRSIVVYRAATPSFIPGQLGFRIDAHSGITTYIPQERFPRLNDRYIELSWWKSTIYVP